MKYYMFDETSVGVSYNDEIPDGAIEVTQDVYLTPEGYTIVDSVLVAPTEDFYTAKTNRTQAAEKFATVSAEIDDLSARISDGEFLTDSDLETNKSILESLRTVRVKLRQYIATGDYLQDLPSEDE